MPVVMETRGVDVGNVLTAPKFSVTNGNGHVVGDLVVSTGGLYWRGVHQQTYRFLNWDSAADLLQNNGDPQLVDR
jgi:hypothetical protein